MFHRKMNCLSAVILFLLAWAAAACSAEVRVKDVAKVLGVRDNQLIGYGIVIGLAGTGDSKAVSFKDQSIANMLEFLDITVDSMDIRTRNSAAVIVTCDLPPFVRPGDRIDITISSIGDAKSLEGGTLLLTTLKAANKKVYAVAQGTITIGGSNNNSTSKSWMNHSTVARIPGGAIVEEEVPVSLVSGGDTISVVLNQPDFTTAQRLAEAIDAKFGKSSAKASDSAVVKIKIPDEYKDDTVKFISALESLTITPDTVSKIVINEKTGTIVIGGNVRIAPSAFSHNNIQLSIGRGKAVPQSVYMIDSEGNSVEELVNALNALGVTPRDLIAILQMLKASGAIQVEIEVI